jgi:XTP/dITP diphosphohydrolase
MLDLFLASGNPHKAEEFKLLLDNSCLSVKAAPEKLDVIEDGTSYFENAFLKAKAYYDALGKPVIADDSGLNVDALPDDLGIHSARFGGEGLSDRERAELLLEKMITHKSDAERGAHFSCVLCFYLSPGEVFYFEGHVDGQIGHQYRGDKGFGYDPVFLPLALLDRGLTYAEAYDWKQQNSHRAVACALANKFFSQRNCQNL